MTTFQIIEEPKVAAWKTLCQRPALNQQDLNALCREVFEAVEVRKDEALLGYTRKFDGVELSSIYAEAEELSYQASLIPDALKIAINQAYANIYTFHKAQEREPIEVETMPGVICRQEARAIERVGLYIPGGTAPLFSTLLMLAIPAQIAGCKAIVLSTPANAEGLIPPAIAYAAQLCGVSQVLKLGGTQAIAALAVGTSRTLPVYKLFGPGNQYVMAAKQYAQELGVAMDLPAGPSEVLVIADDTAQASLVAADLLSQAEHGVDSQVVLVSNAKSLFPQVFAEIKRMTAVLNRSDLIYKSLENARFVYLRDLECCFDFANFYAPEHLILAMDTAELWTDRVYQAGSVFLGHFTPESAGDYASGTNHTLPTKGYARNYSGVSLDAYLRKITFQQISKEGIRLISPTIEEMAKAEGLEAHALASRLRRELATKKGCKDE